MPPLGFATIRLTIAPDREGVNACGGLVGSETDFILGESFNSDGLRDAKHQRGAFCLVSVQIWTWPLRYFQPAPKDMRIRQCPLTL
jgi:hypothetical protein